MWTVQYIKKLVILTNIHVIQVMDNDLLYIDNSKMIFHIQLRYKIPQNPPNYLIQFLDKINYKTYMKCLNLKTKECFMWKVSVPVIFEHNSLAIFPTNKDNLGHCWKVEHDVHVTLTNLIGLKISLNDLAEFTDLNQCLALYVKKNIGRLQGTGWLVICISRTVGKEVEL